MAKRKNSRALFEVINQSKGWQRPPRNTGGAAVAAYPTRQGALPVPGWWSNRSAAASQKASAASGETDSAREEAAENSGIETGEATSAAVATAGVSFVSHGEAARNPRTAWARSASDCAAPPMSFGAGAVDAIAAGHTLILPLHAADDAPGDQRSADEPDSPVAVVEYFGQAPAALSPEQQRKRRIALLSAGGVLAALLLISLMIHRFSAKRSTALGSTPTEVLRRGPAHPSVMDVRRGSAASADQPRQSRALPAAEIQGAQPTFNEPHPPAGVVAHDPNRAANLNYVVAQSYPLSEEKMAQEACDFLTKNGVPCTIERDVHGWPNKLAVVGIDGFSRLSSPEYRAYIARIEKLSSQFAPNRSFKAFQPSAVKWGRS